MSTVQELIIAVETALYQSAGSAVQVYSQDVIAQKIQMGFDHFFTKAWWPQFRVREQRVLDGVNGYVTVPITTITQYDDIRYVFREQSDTPLSKLPLNANLLSPQFSSGDSPKFIEADAANLFRVWPNIATGTVLVVGRARPARFLLDSEVPMDDTLIIHYVAWSYFTDDGSNPEAALKHQTMFEARLKQLTHDMFNEPIRLDPRQNTVPDRWYEGP